MNISEVKGKEAQAAYVALLQHLSQPVKDAKANTGTFSYTYLSLPALLDHIARPLREAGLAMAQEVSGNDGGDIITVRTHVLHLEGGWLQFGPIVFPGPADPQKRGAVISYARRYALLAALGLAAEDDDAASATVSADVHGEGGRRAPAAVDGGREDGGNPPAPPPDDIAATQRAYHPGKAHKMVSSPHAPGLEICVQVATGNQGCTFNRRAA